MTELTTSQQAIVDYFPHFLMSDDLEFTIAGPAGSGKTFLVKYLLQISDHMQKFCTAMDQDVPIRELFFTATTNKAADVLQDMVGQETKTIHSLLGLRIQSDYKTGRQKLINSGNARSLANSIVFIDEASMINRELLSIIRKHMERAVNCKVVYIGDEYQLPPVAEDLCAVFDDGPNTMRLEEIQRQAENSPIIQLSQEYRNCLDDHTRCWPKIQTTAPEIIHYTDKHKYFNVIRKYYGHMHDQDDLKILAWSNTRVREYNQWIRALEGRPGWYMPGELVVTNKPLFFGNQIVVTTDSIKRVSNVWDAEMNGIKGHTIELHGVEGTFFQPWDWKEADALAKVYADDAKQTTNWQPYFVIKEQWADLRPIHASTVHKAQGSTYFDVFIDLNNIGQNNHWREVARLAYVAITRASNSVHIYGELKERYNRRPIVDLMEPFKNAHFI